MFEYVPIEEDLFTEEIGNYKSFSIKVFLVVGDKYEIGIASDVSDDYTLVKRIVGFCNKKQVSPLDLYETVAHFI